MITTTRNATLSDLFAILKDQHARKVDMVVPAASLYSHLGQILVEGVAPTLTEDGVLDANGLYLPTTVADEGLAETLGIPVKYMRRLRTERTDLYDTNVNGWLRGLDGVGADQRSLMLRAFTDGDTGVLRAVLSSSYGILDNLDVLLAALDGVRQAGVQIDIPTADLSDRNMFVRITAPQVAAYAPELMKGYRSPFTGAYGADNPRVFAGIEIRNSEVGDGAFKITPRIVFEVCKNGATITKDAVRSVHLGGRLSDGVISWSQDTQEKSMALVTAKARDAVARFLDVDYVTATLRGIEEAAGIEVRKPEETIKVVSKKLAFSQDQAEGILSHFIKGADTTAGGIFHAVTSWAQEVPDADEAARMEGVSFEAMELAAQLSR